MLIAITGGSGAGKSTLARAVAALAGAQVIAEDDYYRCAGAIAGFNAATHNFDAPEAKDHALLVDHLRRFRAGERFDKPRYDLVTHRRTAEIEPVFPGRALVVDGIHVLCSPDLRALFDVKVFVDADEALRLERRLARDVETRGRTPEAVRTQFFANVRPMHARHVEPQRRFADIVVESRFADGPGSIESAARQVLDAALRHVERGA